MATATSEHACSRRARLLAVLVPIIFFVSFYLYIWLRTDPQLSYYRQCPAFPISLSFLGSFLSYPGGPVEYVSRFFLQFYYYGWAGALVITIAAWLIYLSTRGLLTAMADGPIRPWIYFVPVVLLVLLCNQRSHWLNSTIGILVALGFVNVYVRIGFRGVLPRLVVFVLLSGVVYYLAAGAYVLYATLCGIFELLRNRKIVLGVFCLLLGPAVPYAFATYSYQTGLGAAYAPLLRFVEGGWLSLKAMLSLQKGPYLGLLLFFPLESIAEALRRSRRTSGSAETAEKTPELVPVPGWTFRSLVLFVVITAVSAGFSFNAAANRRLHVDYYTRNRMWNQALREARLLAPKSYNIYIMADVTRALYHTGRLPYEMFAYLQRMNTPSLILPYAKHPNLPTLTQSTDLFFELGNVNLAEHVAHLGTESYDPRPLFQKRLVQINILKGYPQAARAFLGVLKKQLFYRNWADRYLRRLDADPQMMEDEELQRVRAVMLDADYPYGQLRDLSVEPLMQQLLRTNKRNRMAFEYLMAHYLLTCRHDKIAWSIHRLDDFDYVGIPTHYEEAILIYTETHPNQKLDLAGRQISDRTIQRYKGFIRDFASFSNLSYGPEKNTAMETLGTRYGNTYFFYCTFGVSVPGVQPREPQAVTGATK